MGEEWKEVYQKRLLELYHHPIGADSIPESTFKGWSRNRTCGDEVTFHLQVTEDRIDAAWQSTLGCAIATATSSLLVKELQGATLSSALLSLDQVSEMVKTGDEVSTLKGELNLLRAVHSLPSRHDCVGVALRACQAAIHAVTPPQDKGILQ